MDPVELVGYVAAFCTTMAFVPQVARVRRTKSTGDLSLSMFLVFTIGVLLWLVYGVLEQKWPVIVANAVTALLSGYILVQKVRELRAERK